jgi:hypothetical protein
MPVSKPKPIVQDSSNASFAPKIVAMFRQRSVGLREPREVHTLEEYREELRQGLRSVLDNCWYIHVLPAPTGSGKTYAQIALLQDLKLKGKTTVTLAPTHQLCDEIVAQRGAVGIDSAAFPLLDETTCARYEDEAMAIHDMGLSPVKILCPECPYKEGCPHDMQYREALESTNKVATLARGRVSLPMLTKGASCIICDEDPADMLAPIYTLPEWMRSPVQKPNIDREHPLRVVGRIADQAAEAAVDPMDRGYYRHLASVARYLDAEHHAAFETVEVELPRASHHTPPSLHIDLHQAVCDLAIEGSQRPPADAMRIALLATQGKLRLLAVARNESLGVGSVRRMYNVLTGVGKTDLPLDIPTVICNATADLDEIRTLAGDMRPVRNIAPRGSLPLLKPVLQICPKYEVTRSRYLDRAADDLRGIIHDLPQYPRVGLITHSTHHRKIREALGEPYSSRITLESYYGDGLSRGSNEWIDKCDVLILLGPPRPGSSSIRQHLLRLGHVRAANITEEQAEWHRATWTGTTESGMTVEIETPRYRNEDWHRAYCAITRTQIKQAIGRGRGILPNGIPVYIVTTEDIDGLGWGHVAGDEAQTGRAPITDDPFLPLRNEHAEVLAVLAGTTSKAPLKTGEVCAALYGEKSIVAQWSLDRVRGGRPKDRPKANGFTSDRYYKTNRMLTALLKQGRVRRKHKGRGWYIVAVPAAAESP